MISIAYSLLGSLFSPVQVCSLLQVPLSVVFDLKKASENCNLSFPFNVDTYIHWSNLDNDHLEKWVWDWIWMFPMKYSWHRFHTFPHHALNLKLEEKVKCSSWGPMNLARSDIIKMGGNAPRMRMGVQLYLVAEHCSVSSWAELEGERKGVRACAKILQTGQVE